MRSDPLVFKDGEPTNPPITYEKYEPWKVVIKDTETETIRSRKYFSYKEAKARVSSLRDEYGERAEVGLVSRQIGYGPPYSKVSNNRLLEANESGLYWCPYCRQFRDFPYYPYKEESCCEFCLTRERDFHVKACNPLLWNSYHFKRVFGREK